uniref:Uncharacterized protein n=1 Tax=Brassica campestris TaxID=3711 RepID=M4E9L4_BRACM
MTPKRLTYSTPQRRDFANKTHQMKNQRREHEPTTTRLHRLGDRQIYKRKTRSAIDKPKKPTPFLSKPCYLVETPEKTPLTTGSISPRGRSRVPANEISPESQTYRQQKERLRERSKEKTSREERKSSRCRNRRPSGGGNDIFMNCLQEDV